MSPSRTEFARFCRRAARWLWPAALLALTPKCVLCVLAYVGLGAALGLGGPEWCSPAASSPASWATWLAWLGVAGALGTLIKVSRELPARARVHGSHEKA